MNLYIALFFAVIFPVTLGCKSEPKKYEKIEVTSTVMVDAAPPQPTAWIPTTAREDKLGGTQWFKTQEGCERRGYLGLTWNAKSGVCGCPTDATWDTRIFKCIKKKSEVAYPDCRSLVCPPGYSCQVINNMATCSPMNCRGSHCEMVGTSTYPDREETMDSNGPTAEEREKDIAQFLKEGRSYTKRWRNEKSADAKGLLVIALCEYNLDWKKLGLRQHESRQLREECPTMDSEE